MGFFDFIFGKKKKHLNYVVENEDDQSQFLKTDEEMRSSSQRKAQKSKDESAIPAQKSEEKISKSATKSTAESCTDKPTDKKPKKSTASSPTTKSKAVEVGDCDIDLEKTVSVKEGKATRNGKFDIRRAKDGRFFFCLYASNYMPIAYSQIYSTSSAALNGIESIIANSPKAPTEDTTLKNPSALPFPKWEIYIDKAGEYRFRLYAVNGNCICHSAHGYATKSGCKGGMESITRFAKEAKVDKTYLK